MLQIEVTQGERRTGITNMGINIIITGIKRRKKEKRSITGGILPRNPNPKTKDMMKGEKQRNTRRDPGKDTLLLHSMTDIIIITEDVTRAEAETGMTGITGQVPLLHLRTRKRGNTVNIARKDMVIDPEADLMVDVIPHDFSRDEQ